MAEQTQTEQRRVIPARELANVARGVCDSAGFEFNDSQDAYNDDNPKAHLWRTRGKLPIEIESNILGLGIRTSDRHYFNALREEMSRSPTADVWGGGEVIKLETEFRFEYGSHRFHIEGFYPAGTERVFNVDGRPISDWTERYAVEFVNHRDYALKSAKEDFPQIFDFLTAPHYWLEKHFENRPDLSDEIELLGRE